MSMNVNIVIDDPEELERVRQKEMDITKALPENRTPKPGETI